MSEIRPGAQVRITFDARTTWNHGEVAVESGDVIHNLKIPEGATVEVISDPLPPQPPVGAWARFVGDGFWKYVQRLADGWYRDGNHAYLPSSWEDIASLNPEVLAEQPQEKYEHVRVLSETRPGETSLLWFHPCGYAGRWLSDATPTVCRNCDGIGPWTPLYVKADSDG